MSKADRELFDTLLRKCDHYERLAIEQCINYGLTSKRKELARLKEKFGA